jgi:hypothetical protein
MMFLLSLLQLLSSLMLTMSQLWLVHPHAVAAFIKFASVPALVGVYCVGGHVVAFIPAVVCLPALL